MTSFEESDLAVTNKPLSEYEAYVELIATCMANGLAMATERSFLLGLDQSVSLEQAFLPHARSFIKYRGSFIIDRIVEGTDL